MTILLKMAWPNTVRTLHKLAKAAESCAENMGKKTIFGKDKFHKPHVYFLYELELTIQAMMEDGRVRLLILFLLQSSFFLQKFPKVLFSLQSNTEMVPSWEWENHEPSYLFRCNHLDFKDFWNIKPTQRSQLQRINPIISCE